MTRVLTAFENEMRSDLILGQGNRWEVSSPRDELEKFRFFVRQTETLIDQAKESEVSSLQESIAGWSKEAQDDFWPYYYPIHWDEIFRSTIRRSVVVSLATFLETFLNRLCSHVALVTKSDLKASDLKGSTLERARKYLNAVGKLERPGSTEWDELGLFFKIRNVIVHADGFTLGSSYQKAIEHFCEKRSDIRLAYGSIEIEPAFLEFFIDRLKEFIEQLEGEFRALCEETRRVERIGE